MIMIGEPTTVARRYNELNFGKTIHEASEQLAGQEQAGQHRDAFIVDGWFEDADGTRIPAIAHREWCTACVEVHFNAPLDDPIFGMTLRNDVGATVFATTTALDIGPSGHFGAGETVVVRMRFETWFTQTRYTLTPSIARGGMGADTIDLRADLASLVVHGGNFTTGVVDLPHEFQIERR
jgi:hypothetical protein